MISAEGKKYGQTIKVVYDKNKFLFNGKQDKFFEDDIRFEMKLRHPIGGTYYTEDINDVLNIAGVLRRWFFDETNVEVLIQDEDVTDMPSEELIY